MDNSVKASEHPANIIPLRLSGYANGHHATALKVVHWLNDWEEGASHTPLHSHNFYELVVVLRGKGTHLVESQRQSIRPGSVYLLVPGEKHCYEYLEPLVLLTFMFDRQILRPFRADLAQMPGCTELFSPGGPKPEFLLDAMTIAELDIQLNAIAAETRRCDPGSRSLLAAHLLQTLVLILRNTRHDENPGSGSGAGGVGAAVSFMLRHFDEEIQLAKLARLASLSESSFFRKFRGEFGMPPMQWLLRLRIRKAMEYLIRSDKTIAEIAQMTGFADPLYFSRQFRKVTGTTPRKYRTEDYGPLQIVRGFDISMEDRKL